MKVLITRPEPEASAFAAICKAQGMTPILSPLIQIEILKRDVALSGVGALAFTSANGVRAFAENSTDRRLPVFAVGEASAAAAKAAGFEMIETADGDVDALAGLVAKRREIIAGDVLHVAGTHRAGDLVAALRREGVPARRDVLYETRDAKALPAAVIAALTRDDPIDWVTLFSPRSVLLFLALAQKAGVKEALGNTRAACLSDAVAKQAGAAQWKSVEIAAGRNAAAMVSLLLSA